MRIISQNGMDFPYDRIIVYTDENSVMCKTLNDGKRYCLGIYKDCDRANEVFKSIYMKSEMTSSTTGGSLLLLEKTFIMPEE